MHHASPSLRPSAGPARRPVPAWAFAVTFLLGVALTAFARPPQPVLRAERVELVSPQGAALAVLGADTAGVYLLVLDARGRPASRLHLGREPWLAVQTGDGQAVAGLGAPKVHELSR